LSLSLSLAVLLAFRVSFPLLRFLISALYLLPGGWRPLYSANCVICCQIIPISFSFGLRRDREERRRRRVRTPSSSAPLFTISTSSADPAPPSSTSPSIECVSSGPGLLRWEVWANTTPAQPLFTAQIGFSSLFHTCSLSYSGPLFSFHCENPPVRTSLLCGRHQLHQRRGGWITHAL
ncbi:hypothetical protein H112_07512, partial [Trichophyton rubrum D6]